MAFATISGDRERRRSHKEKAISGHAPRPKTTNVVSCDEQRFTSQPNKRCVMRGYARVASVGLLMMGLLAVPNLSLATDRDGNGRHSLLNAELRSKIEHLRDKMANHREDHHNQGDLAGGLAALQT